MSEVTKSEFVYYKDPGFKRTTGCPCCGSTNLDRANYPNGFDEHCNSCNADTFYLTTDWSWGNW